MAHKSAVYERATLSARATDDAEIRAKVARKPDPDERALYELHFTQFADTVRGKIPPEAFVRLCLDFPFAAHFSFSGRWRALTYAFSAADLDEDGMLDLPETVLALRLIPIAEELVLGGTLQLERIQRLLVVPPSAVPVAKRALAIKREVALRSVRKVFLS